MTVSTNSVFHFTSKKSNLNSILKDGGFKMKYCLEEYNLSTEGFAGSIPMVSFCDIPLSKSFKHIQSYGSYSLGLSKEWASQYGLNPVLYIEDGSIASQLIEPFLVDTLTNDPYGDIKKRKLMTQTSDSEYKIEDIFRGERARNINASVALLSFIKNHEGRLERKNKKPIEKYRFYDEREWRYVPTAEEFERAKLVYYPFCTPSEHEESKKNNGKDIFLPKLLLPFSAKDIDYVLVKKDSEIPSTIKLLKRERHLYNNEDELGILISRLTSVEKLKSDL